MALETRRTPPYAPLDRLDRGDFQRVFSKTSGRNRRFQIEDRHFSDLFYPVEILSETPSSLKPLNDDLQKFAGTASQDVHARRVGGARHDRREDVLTAQRHFQTGEGDRMK